jgi:hypothetical protein
MTTPPPDRPRPGRSDRRHASGHPAGRAALLMIGVVLLIVLLAAAPLLIG